MEGRLMRRLIDRKRMNWMSYLLFHSQMKMRMGKVAHSLTQSANGRLRLMKIRE